MTFDDYLDVTNQRFLSREDAETFLGTYCIDGPPAGAVDRLMDLDAEDPRLDPDTYQGCVELTYGGLVTRYIKQDDLDEIIYGGA